MAVRSRKTLPVENIETTLRGIGTRPMKSYGQNFLVNGQIADGIVECIPEKDLEHIIEVGPGLGILTERLLKRGAKVIAVEKDRLLCDYLKKKFHSGLKGYLEVINDDALHILDSMGERDHFMVSNLPFNISSSFTGRLLDSTRFIELKRNPFKGAVIMYQKEFAGRLISPCGSRNYGKLSVMFRTKMDFKHLFDVKKNMFHPQPRVDASVISYRPKEEFTKIPEDPEMFRKLVHVVFLNRRKKLKNALNPRSIGLDLDMDDIEWILEDMDVADRRPEQLDENLFMELSNKLSRLA